ncbi:MAG: photosynthetic reaction center subunit [Pseudomonadota bacterium]|jgi:photosynthetic reaction center H subunit
MGTGAITSYIDTAQIVLYMFWIFFFGLIYYLLRENHREGYPMDNDSGTVMEGWPIAPPPKTYRLADGREVQVPRADDGPPDQINAEPTYRGAGSPIEPTGDPLLAGVGPGTWSSLRPDIPDPDAEGHPRIVPLSTRPGFGVSGKDPDPRGMTVFDARGEVAGTVRDLWIDHADMLFRYLEAEVPAPGGGSRRVLVPMTFARVNTQGVRVHALLAGQFAGIPATRAPDCVTLLEEERITAYFGAGLLYAEPGRTEPLI